jgi:hypothetical protein
VYSAEYRTIRKNNDRPAVGLDGSVNDTELREMNSHSYELVVSL